MRVDVVSGQLTDRSGVSTGQHLRVSGLQGGPVLGVLEGAGYGQEDFDLGMDTALVLVTDGVVEGPGTPLESGLNRAGALAAQALVEGLGTQETADRVLGAGAEVDYLDDMAVLVIRRTEKNDGN